MVCSSALAVSTNSKHLIYSGFSLSETICLAIFVFIADYFDGLSLSPRRSYSGTALMCSTHSRPSSPGWAMIENSTEEFHMV
jgi:hypothetical protein